MAVKNALFLICFLSTMHSFAQWERDNYESAWKAKWIIMPGIDGNEAGLYLFRKNFTLDAIPEDFPIHVSADNRYKLFVNEKLVSIGPALGDLDHWNYATIDLSPHLLPGHNTIAAKVWNEGNLKAICQFSWQTGFILQGASLHSQLVNTNESWKCIQDKSYTPNPQKVIGYYAAEAGEMVDMQFRIKEWNSLNFSDEYWSDAVTIEVGGYRGYGTDYYRGWKLQPSIIPPLEMTYQRFVKTSRSDGIRIPDEFPAQKVDVLVPAKTTARILLDQTFLTNAFFTLLYSGGENSRITLTYAEALYDASMKKGHRDHITDKIMIGRSDTLISDGSLGQKFTTLSYRTYRYVELVIETDQSPLVIKDVYGHFTGYPFELNAQIETEIEELQEMFDIGWRTARLCAVDTYMDCPYYERLQYVGDTRIQHLVSFYNSGDERLIKNTINLFDQSRQKGGYTLSRYPDTHNQVIPTYSLWYIPMVHDYLMYGKDLDFVKGKLMGTRQILDYFMSFQMDDGSLKQVPGWNFTDWVEEWSAGIAPVGADGSSALMDLHLLLAFQAAADLEKQAGIHEYSMLYSSLAEKLAKTFMRKYWDVSRGLFADTPEKNVFSQHTNSLVIIAGLVKGETAKKIGKTMISDTTLAQASIYFKYYLHSALTHAGLGDDYLHWLGIWRENIAMGLTTWAERFDVSSVRSDCHAWGASPNIDFFRIILGIESAAPNFKQVKIEPQLGEIKQIGGKMPHPEGSISVQYNFTGSNLNAKIVLPEKVSGSFIWKDNIYQLHGGTNNLKF